LTLDEAKAPFTEKQLEALELVNDYFGILTASKLRRLSHADKAWQVARSNGGDDLSLEDMKESCLLRLSTEE
jgi:uncharacterized phage-associated protein